MWDTHISALADVEMAPERAIPCALLVSELVTNSLKHAFPGERPGCLRVELQRLAAGRVQLTVKDDGVGLGRDFPAEQSSSLGLDLVAIFTKQLDAELEVQRHEGTCFVFRFAQGQP